MIDRVKELNETSYFNTLKFSFFSIVIFPLLFISCSKCKDPEYIEKILGVDITYFDCKVYESVGGFSEGVFINEIKFDKTTTQSFISIKDKWIPSNNHYDYKFNWKRFDSEIKDNHEELFVLLFNHNTGNINIDRVLDKIEFDIQNENKWHIAFYHNTHYSDVEVYLFDTESDTFFLISIQV